MVVDGNEQIQRQRSNADGVSVRGQAKSVDLFHPNNYSQSMGRGMERGQTCKVAS